MIIRDLSYDDLPERVRWMNDVRVNSTLNVQLPVSLDSTRSWYERNKQNDKRRDFSFVDNDVLVAMGGFTSIDEAVGKAELYIFVNPDIHGKGFGKESIEIMCKYGFEEMGLKKIYLYTNSDNSIARHIYEKLGFVLEGYMPQEIMNNGEIKDRCYYSVYREGQNPEYHHFVDFFTCHDFIVGGIRAKIVRDDLFPFIGGGNKGRKAVEYENELITLGCNAIVTTGGIQSNHNRAVALMAAKNNWKCHLVYHGSKSRFDAEKGNALMVRCTNATKEFVEADQISNAMDSAMQKFKDAGLNPYYVTGGGHDIPGGMAYVKAVHQLYRYSRRYSYKPDYIFLATGTGSTQAGILVGLELMGWSDVKVVGISVARRQERGEQVVAEFANMLGKHCGLEMDFSDKVCFVADYLFGGYECYNADMKDFIETTMRDTGILFDTTYSGKALYGMSEYVKRNEIGGNILFWHTGGIMNLMK